MTSCGHDGGDALGGASGWRPVPISVSRQRCRARESTSVAVMASRRRLVLGDCGLAVAYVVLLLAATGTHAAAPVWLRLVMLLGTALPAGLRRLWPLPVFA